jgi:formylglycine-generating enzyme required for sulfatase activity
MNYIPPGTFEMGCTPEMDVEGGCEDDEYPVHEVTLTQGYYLGITEVTQGQWESVMGDNPSDFSACGDDCPVEQVSWEDAIAFANALSALDGLTAAYDADGNVDPEANGYRLPTEAEWEYAARAGDETAFAGSDVIDEVAWYDDNSSGTTHPVGGLAPNDHGLYDMSGNVREWCGDWYADDYYDVSPVTDPTGAPSGALRVNHGGSWDVTPQLTRIADRYWNTPIYLNNFLGLRLARTVHTDADGDGYVAAIDCDDDDPDIGEDCPPLTMVETGDIHTCLTNDLGEVTCFGLFAWDSLPADDNVPAGAYLDIAGAAAHACAVAIDGTIECWGSESYALFNPVPAGTFVAVDVSNSASCALDEAGSILCWGQDDAALAVEGEPPWPWPMDASYMVDVAAVAAAPPGGTFTQLALGYWHACALQTDLTVECWGMNAWDNASPPAGTFMEVASGAHHSCGLHTDGSIGCWGVTDGVRSGSGAWDWGQVTETPEGGGYKAISAGYYSSCALNAADEIECWGLIHEEYLEPAGTYAQISVGGYHACAVDFGGEVSCWGYNDSGQVISTP